MPNLIHYHIDEPTAPLIDDSAIRLRGWIAAGIGSLRGVALFSSQSRLKLTMERRIDVQAEHKNLDVMGFTADLRVAHHLAAISDSQLAIYMVCASRVVGGVRFDVTGRALSLATQEVSGY